VARRAVVLVVGALCLYVPRANAQVSDSALTARPKAVAVDTTRRPPISPRRAFLSSLAVPGLGQSRLQRSTATAFFATVELLGITMLRKSLGDLRSARRFAGDSVVTEYLIDAATGLAVRDSLTGLPRVSRRTVSVYGTDLIDARRTHLEDWIAVLAFNHLIAGADAYVAAQLWDVPARVSLRALPHGALISAHIAW
jgi:hypothetical protein